MDVALGLRSRIGPRVWRWSTRLRLAPWIDRSCSMVEHPVEVVTETVVGNGSVHWPAKTTGWSLPGCALAGSGQLTSCSTHCRTPGSTLPISEAQAATALVGAGYAGLRRAVGGDDANLIGGW